MRRIIATTLLFISIFVFAHSVHAATPTVIEPRYTNVQTATVSLSISDSGLATAKVTVFGKAALAETDVVMYLEKQTGSAWTRVDIGTPGDVWEYSTTNKTFVKSYTHQLSSSGHYRAVAEFTFTANTVEEVTKTATATY